MKDNDIYGEGNAYDFGARIQDPRLGGIFLSIDPLFKNYADESPYNFAGMNPIANTDYMGLFKFSKTMSKEDRTAANTMVNSMKAEVNSWGNDSKELASFLDHSGLKSKKEIFSKMLNDGVGPEFVWGDHNTDYGTLPDGSPAILMKPNGSGFEKGASYALTDAEKSIFDDGLKSIAQTVDRLKGVTGSGSITSFAGTIGVKSMQDEVAKAMKFMAVTGLHEILHYSVASGNIPFGAMGDAGFVFKPLWTQKNGLTIQNIERGVSWEKSAYGTNIQYTSPSSGIIPLIEYTTRSVSCWGNNCHTSAIARNGAAESAKTFLKTIADQRGYTVH